MTFTRKNKVISLAIESNYNLRSFNKLMFNLIDLRGSVMT